MLDFSDYHSVIGVSVEADIKEIRKNYLKIARRLHPDSSVLTSESDRHLASQFLSKMVNPAWEKLSQERTRVDHAVLLKLKGQGAMRHQTHTQVLGSLAKQLLTANNLDYFYRTALQDLADRQYQQLDQVLELTAQISELNLVYLARKEGKGEGTIGEPKKTALRGCDSNLYRSSQFGSSDFSLRPRTARFAPRTILSSSRRIYEEGESRASDVRTARCVAN